MPVLVSCVVPVYNAERFLPETLQSVLGQTYPSLEIIVVNDGSTDRSAEVAAAQDRRVKVLAQPNQGEAAARNAGIGAAAGELIAFIDADDIWHPEKIARQVARLDEQPDIDLCFTQFQNFWNPELPDAARCDNSNSTARPSAAWSVCTLLARANAFERFGLFDDALRRFPNMTWFVRAADQGARIDVLPSVLMRRRIHGSSVATESKVTREDEFLPMLKAWRDLQRKNARA